jgi:PKD repeat protein
MSIVDSATPDQTGSVALELLSTTSQVVLVSTQQGNIALLGYIFVESSPSSGASTAALENFLVLPYSAQTALQGDSPEFSAHSTALALVMLSPLLIGSPPEIRREFAASALTNASFPSLESAIESALMQDPEHVLDPNVHPEIYQRAAQISDDVFEQMTTAELTSTSTSRSTTSAGNYRMLPNHIRKPDPGLGDPQPWIEDDPQNPTGIVLKNPKEINYGFIIRQIREDGTRSDVGGGLLPRKKFWDIIIDWPPSLPGFTKKTYNLPTPGSYEIIFSRGLFGAADNPHFQDARLWNLFDAILEAVDLFISVRRSIPNEDIEYVLGLMEQIIHLWHLIDECFANALAVDAEGLFDCVHYIAYWMFTERTADVAELAIRLGRLLFGIDAAQMIGEFLSNVGPVKVAVMTVKFGSKVPYFFDLVTAPVWWTREKSFGYQIQKLGPESSYIPQIADLSATPDRPQIGQRVTFKADAFEIPVFRNIFQPPARETMPEHEPLICRWDFGDGTIATTFETGQDVSTVEHAFATPGLHTVTLEVSNSEGVVGKTTVQVNVVGNLPPIARIIASPTSGVVPLTVHFDGSTSSDPDGGSIKNHWWNFGDTFTATGAVVDHTYMSAGTYTATLTVEDDEGARGSATVTITVAPPATPILQVSPINLSFSAQHGGANPPSQLISITNTGGGTLNWSLTDNAAWLSTNINSGTAPSDVTVSANITGLAAGTYNATITIIAPGAQNSPQNVDVTLTITPEVVSARYWAATYGSDEYNVAKSIQPTSDGGFIVAGYIALRSPYFLDYWVAKLDSSSNIVWQRAFGGDSGAEAQSIQETSDGGYIVAGDTYSFGTEGTDIWVVKLDSLGNIVWQKTYGRSNSDTVNAVSQTGDGGYLVAGATENLGSDNYYYKDAWIFKLDSNGNPVWQKTYGGSYDDEAKSIQPTSDGGYVVAGFTRSFGGRGSDAWVLKLDSMGNIVWQRAYDNYEDGSAASIQPTSDGGYIFAGTTSFRNPYWWVVKLDSVGDILWHKYFPDGYQRSSPCCILETSDHQGYIIAGRVDPWFADMYIRLMELDTSGNVVWQKTYDTDGTDNAFSIQKAGEDGYIVAGSTRSFTHSYKPDFFIMKVDAEGNIALACSAAGLVITPTDAPAEASYAMSYDTTAMPVDTTVNPLDTSATVTNTDVSRNLVCAAPN